MSGTKKRWIIMVGPSWSQFDTLSEARKHAEALCLLNNEVHTIYEAVLVCRPCEAPVSFEIIDGVETK